MFRNIPLELLIWIAALTILIFSNPYYHYSICPLKNLQVNWCPGCGLGRSIYYIFRGDLQSSINHHWLGVPAVFILFQRIFQLFRMFFNQSVLIKS
ncbi:DUF2752 domain-containing protein [Daejeonella oryzae]|uniref:DUF2752 domain-containing protein n=1 Tax=Daejeonella oryzae TaxID=1122943 RepID=UPI00041F12A7